MGNWDLLEYRKYCRKRSVYKLLYCLERPEQADEEVLGGPAGGGGETGGVKGEVASLWVPSAGVVKSVSACKAGRSVPSVGTYSRATAGTALMLTGGPSTRRPCDTGISGAPSVTPTVAGIPRRRRRGSLPHR